VSPDLWPDEGQHVANDTGELTERRHARKLCLRLMDRFLDLSTRTAAVTSLLIPR
jgi:hypothetical protein